MPENNENDRPRRRSFKVYSTEPKSERGTFVQFIEESGANALLIEAVSRLFEVSEKPENPIEWLKLHFRQFAPKRNEHLQNAQRTLTDDIIKQESRLTRLRLEENRLKERLEYLQFEGRNQEVMLPHSHHDENYRRYKEHPDDYRWRIQPDPLYRMTKSDTLIQIVENENKRGDERKISSYENAEEQPMSRATGYSSKLDNYDDYPKLYFKVNEDVSDVSDPQIVEESFTVDGISKEDPEKVVEQKEETVGGENEGETKVVLPGEEFGGEGEYEEETGPDKVDVADPSAKRSTTLKQPISGGGTAEAKTDSSEVKELKDKKKVKKGRRSKSPGILMDEEGDSSEEMGNKREDECGKWRLNNNVVQELPPLPLDPLEFELEPVDASYWKENFTLTKGHEKMFEDGLEDFGYEDQLFEDDDDDMSYTSSRGEKRKRLFRSQIIQEAFWKPDRGRSIQFDGRFDIADIPVLSSNASSVQVPTTGVESELLDIVPSKVSANASETMGAIKSEDMPPTVTGR